MTLVIAARQVRSSLVAALAVLCLNRLSPIGAEGAQLVPAQSAARRRVTQWFYRSSGPSARRSRGCRHQDDGDLNACSAHARHPCKRWDHGGGDPTGCIVSPSLTAPDASANLHATYASRREESARRPPASLPEAEAEEGRERAHAPAPLLLGVTRLLLARRQLVTPRSAARRRVRLLPAQSSSLPAQQPGAGHPSRAWWRPRQPRWPFPAAASHLVGRPRRSSRSAL